LPAFSQTGDLGSMTVDELWEKADTLYRAGDVVAARPIYLYIAEHFPENQNRAPWSLYRLTSISYNERDINTALALIQRILDNYPESGICKSGYMASYLTAINLVYTKDYQAGIDAGEEHLEKFGPTMAPRERAVTVERVARCYMGLGDNETAVAKLKQYALLYPPLLSRPEWYTAAFDAHLAMKDGPGALSVARAAYALCDYDEKTLQNAAELVRRGFISNGELHKGIQFLAAQENAENPNPLRDVPLPQLTPEEKEQLLQAAGQDKPKRLLALIYTGDAETAVAVAVGYMCEAGADQAVSSLQEVARALKAADCNVVRANQFIQYAKTGQGENPVADVEPE
jgi:tetratricopeptide (TPR) repeat protein